MVTLQNFIHRSKRPTYNTSKFKSRGDSGVLESSLALRGKNEVYFFVIMTQLKSARAIFVWPWNDFENARTKQKKQTNLNTAIWLVYRTDTNARGFWLVSECSGARELSRSQSILPFDVILQHDWPIEQCLLYIRVFFGGKTKSPCFDLFIHWLIKQITDTYRNHFSRSYENRSKHICLTWRFLYSFSSGFIHLVWILPDGSMGHRQTPELSQRIWRLSERKESCCPFSVIDDLNQTLYFGLWKWSTSKKWTIFNSIQHLYGLI